LREICLTLGRRAELLTQADSDPAEHGYADTAKYLG
jgi:hypothetical protein